MLAPYVAGRLIRIKPACPCLLYAGDLEASWCRLVRFKVNGDRGALNAS